MNKEFLTFGISNLLLCLGVYSFLFLDNLVLGLGSIILSLACGFFYYESWMTSLNLFPYHLRLIAGIVLLGAYFLLDNKIFMALFAIYCLGEIAFNLKKA